MAAVVVVLNAAGKAEAAVVAWYRSDDGMAGNTAGTILDSSSAGNNGTSFGTPVYSADVPGLPGLTNTGSLEFDGSKTDYLSFASNFIFHTPGGATLEFFLKPVDQGHAAIFWSRSGSSDGNRFHVYLSGITEGLPAGTQAFGMDYREANGNLHFLVPPPHTAFLYGTNEWTHFAITRSGNTYSYYRNGHLQMQGVDTNPNLPSSTGWEIAGRTHDFTGLIDEVRMSTDALQPNEFLNAVPEPSSLIGLSFAGIGRWRRRKVG